MTTKAKRKAARPGTTGPRSAGRLQAALDATARREITAALEETQGNVTQAAKALGITIMSLRKRLRSMQIAPDTYRP